MNTDRPRFVVLTRGALMELVDAQLKQAKVLAPVTGGEEGTRFEFITDAREIYLDYATTIMPPTKKVFLPQEGVTFLTWKKENGKTVFASPADPEPLVVFGVHPYDIRAFQIWEETMLRGKYEDPVTKARLATLTIVGLDITEPPRDSFAASVDAHVVTDGYDLMLTILATDRILAEARTEKGAALLEGITYRDAAQSDIVERDRLREERATKYPHTLPTSSESVSEFLMQHANHPLFTETGDLCVACGKCTVICPTCTCFSPVEHSTLDGTEGARTRVAASCQVPVFTLVAGGMINRKSAGDRFAHRLFDKFVYHESEGSHGCMTTCVGCGRCVAICPAHIADPVKTIEQLQQGAHHE